MLLILIGGVVGVQCVWGEPAAQAVAFKPKFIMALARDSAGNVWVGMEDQGVGRIDPSGKQKQFTTKDGLGDDHIYALAVDRQGRVWAGHLKHGVSVYNGRRWQNYDVVSTLPRYAGGGQGGGRPQAKGLPGPLGGRVFDIAVCPTDGDVWMATNLGLSRYSIANKTWTYYTRADGLPSDQIETLAFDQHGALYVGTQCDGLAISHPDRRGDYLNWRVLKSRFVQEPPQTPTGQGLPSNFINDILIGQKGKIWIATDEGLAWSNHGRRFQFIRGKEWLAKLKGLYQAPSKAGLSRLNKYYSKKKLPLLSEDYSTCLAQDAKGRIWIGHWRTGFDALDLESGQMFTTSSPLLATTVTRTVKGKKVQRRSNVRDDVTAILPIPGEAPLLGTYGGGLLRLPEKFSASARPRDGPHRTNRAAALPAAASLKSDQWQAMLSDVQRVRPADQDQSGTVVPIEDDWRTEGDWLGRYGRYWACLCAICSPNNYLWGAGAQPVGYHITIGPHHRKGDQLRYWVHWLHTSNPNSLEMPPTYLDSRIVKGYTTIKQSRRQASMDDHGETYRYTTYEGPNLWIRLDVPKGAYRLSLYFFNKDGHGTSTRLRDYVVQMKRYIPRIDVARAVPPLATARVHDFWHGVYKRFIVTGGRSYWIFIDKNYGLDTILSGIFLDSLDPTSEPYFPQQQVKADPTGTSAADQIFAALEALRMKNPQGWAIHAGRYYAAILRHDLSLNPTEQQSRLRQIGVCEYRLHLYPQWEANQKERGLHTARSIEHALKWDQKMYSCSGKERQILTNYLAVQRGAADQHGSIYGKDAK